jgi:predicted alpha/beta hydrolase family esterase
MARIFVNRHYDPLDGFLLRRAVNDASQVIGSFFDPDSYGALPTRWLRSASMEWVFRLVAIHLVLCMVPVFVGGCVLAMEHGQLVRPSREGVGWFFREWAAYVLALPMLMTGLLPTQPKRHARGEDIAEIPRSSTTRRPVLLVHGYGLNRGCWRFVQTYLHTRGWSWVWAINHRPRSRPIPVYADNLRMAVDWLLAESGAKQVDIVAHSMGGVIAAWYMTQLDGANKVHRLVTLGTPWQGTKTHVFAWRREARDLAPDAKVIEDIQQAKGDIVAIWSRSDHLVIPTSSAAPAHAQTIEIPHLGHLEMLTSARVFRTVADALTLDVEE